jgi:hypothetical protein
MQQGGTCKPFNRFCECGTFLGLGGRSWVILTRLKLRDPMQNCHTEQNERRTLQCEFDVRSLEEGQHTPQHLFISLRIRLRRNVRASRRSHHPPNGGSRGASKGGCEGTAAHRNRSSFARIHCFKVGVFHCALKTMMLLTRRKNQRQPEEALVGERWQIERIMECRRARDFARAKRACARFSTLSLMKMCLT